MIEIDGLTKRFGAVTAVQDATFGVQPGVVTGFLGPNGAGKTTTLRMLLGLARPTAGKATIDGAPYAQLAEPTKTVGAVLETAGFHPGRSGRDHLRVLATAGSIPAPRVDEVLELVGLAGAANRAAGGYSLGMRQRLALASALLGDPRVLILDEPANGLDPQGIRWLRDLLRWLASQGRVVFVSSHVLAEMQQTVDEVVVINRGRVVAQGRLDDLTGGTAVRVRSPQADRLAELARARDIRVEERDGALRMVGTTGEAVGELAAANQIVLHELAAEAHSLEDVFLQLTEGVTA